MLESPEAPQRMARSRLSVGVALALSLAAGGAAAEECPALEAFQRVEAAASALLTIAPERRAAAAAHLRATLGVAAAAPADPAFDGSGMLATRERLLAAAEAGDWPRVDAILNEPAYRRAGADYRSAADEAACLDDPSRSAGYAGEGEETPFDKALPTSATVDRKRKLGDSSAESGKAAGSGLRGDPIARQILEAEEERRSLFQALYIVLAVAAAAFIFMRLRRRRRWGRRFACWQPATVSTPGRKIEGVLVALDRRRARIRVDERLRSKEKVRLAFCGAEFRASVVSVRDGLATFIFRKRLSLVRFVAIRRVAATGAGGIGDLTEVSLDKEPPKPAE